MFEFVTGCIAAVLIVFVIVGGLVYGVQSGNEKYYSAMNSCVSNGGTFLPGGSNSPMCINTGKKQ